MAGFAEYLWRLLPGNPILLRVVETAGRRLRDLFARCGYLGLLIIIVIFQIFGAVNTASGGDLSELNITSQEIFSSLSTVQLLLVALLAPMFTAGAITQEKDSQTYDILLSTPLTNAQIVLGSLASRLFFIFTLLLSGIPVFSITQVFGGVAIGDIVLSTLIAAATALITGSLAIAIATFKVGTRRTIFSFYLFNAVYLVGLYLLDKAPFMRLPLADGSVSHISYLTPIHPFLSLETILDPVRHGAPTISQLPAHLQIWPIGFALTRPATFFILLQVVLSAIMVLPSIVLMRRIAQSTTSIKSQLLRLVPIRFAGVNRPARTVWNNPIAWREAKTKASAARATITRLGFVLLGVAGAIVLLIGYSSEKIKPKRWIEYGCYSVSSSTVTIRGETNATYLLTPNSKFQLAVRSRSDAPVRLPFERLHEKWEVVDVLPILNRQTGAQEIGTLVVQPIARLVDLSDARKFLLGLILVEVSVILVTVTMASASTVTREKEDGTLDLLLSTPITSRYYLWGKLHGLVSNVLPLMALPWATCLMFVIYDFIRHLNKAGQGSEWVALPESIIVLPAIFIVLAAFAGIIGMQLSLRLKTTTWAVISSMAVLFGALGALGMCGYSIFKGGSGAAPVFGALSPMTAIMLMIAPQEMLDDPMRYDPGWRIIALIFSLVSAGLYVLLIWFMYTSMVKNFDMTIRRQQR